MELMIEFKMYTIMIFPNDLLIGLLHHPPTFHMESIWNGYFMDFTWIPYGICFDIYFKYLLL
jgi:hypothetical protein